MSASLRGMLLAAREGRPISNQFTATVERDGKWFIAYCAEIPGANGQGESKEQCLANLADAIELILEDRREDAGPGSPSDAGSCAVQLRF